ncbi:class I SAM-dependent methyltransferase [Nautilia lithotrophica]
MFYKYRISEEYIFYSKKKQDVESIKRTLFINQEKYYNFLHPKWTHFLRKQEIELLVSKLKKNQKILEIGSGDGYVAYILKEKYGLDITASDLNPRFPQYTNVLKIDGQSTNLKDKQYDVIISIHVLEHIENIDNAMHEFKRLLKDDGKMYHLVPSTNTMLLTIFMQPFSYIRAIYLYINGYFFTKYQPFRNKNILRFIKNFILTLNPINLIWGAGHGVYNRFGCLYYWKREKWKETFERNNLVVEDIQSNEILYSLHKIFPFKFLKVRKMIARIFGGSSNLFILRKK